MCPERRASGAHPALSAILDADAANEQSVPKDAPGSTGTDVPSAKHQPDTKPALQQRHVWTRIILAITSLLSLLIGGLAYANGDGNVRVIALLYFTLFGLGSGPLGLLPTLRLPARLSLTFLLSMSTMTFVSLGMSTYSFWHPVPAFIVVATIASVTHTLTLVQAWQDLRSAHRAKAEAASASERPDVRAIVRALGLGWICIAAGLVLWLTAALNHRHIDPGFGGFLTEIGPLWYAGLLLILIGLFLGRNKPEWVAATAVVVLMLALTLTPSIVYDGARSTTGAKHVGLIQQIRLGTPLDTNVLIYNYWNGFFAAMAWLSDLLGLKDPNYFSAFWPSIIGLFRIAALRYLASRFFDRAYHAWTFVALCLLADPIGADYYSPQSVGFVIGITAVAIALSPTRMRIRGPALLLAGCLLAVSHQLSPYVTAGTLIVLVIFRQLRPWWSPLLVLLPANLWALIHRDALKGFISLGDIGQAQNFSPPKTPQVEGLVRLPIVTDASLALVGGIGILAILAGISILRFRDRQAWAMGFCAMSGFVFVAVSPYGNEGIFRAFLFSIPWLALLTMRWVTTRSWEKLGMFGLRPIMIGLLGTYLLASFGLDALNVTKPGDLHAFQTFESTTVKPADAPAYLMQIGAGNLPGILASKAARQTELGRGAFYDGDTPSEFADADGPATVARLTRKLLTLADETPAEANLYAVWSPLSSEFGRAYALETPATFARLRDAFIHSQYWDIVTQKDGTILFRFNGAHYVTSSIQ